MSILHLTGRGKNISNIIALSAGKLWLNKGIALPWMLCSGFIMIINIIMRFLQPERMNLKCQTFYWRLLISSLLVDDVLGEGGIYLDLTWPNLTITLTRPCVLLPVRSFESVDCRVPEQSDRRNRRCFSQSSWRATGTRCSAIQPSHRTWHSSYIILL